MYNVKSSHISTLKTKGCEIRHRPICERNPANNERQKWVELKRSGLCWDTKRAKLRAHCLSADRVFERSHILGLTFAEGPPVITLIGPARPFVGKVDVL